MKNVRGRCRAAVVGFAAAVAAVAVVYPACGSALGGGLTLAVTPAASSPPPSQAPQGLTGPPWG
jgi:hypothetical protein